jgi:hypothetical protein
VTRNVRREAVETLRRFMRGEAGADEIEGVARDLEVDSVGEICESLSLSDVDFRQIDLSLRDVARELRLYLDGGLSHEKILRWVSHIHGIVTSLSYESSTVSNPALGATLRLLSILLDSRLPAPEGRRKRSIARLHRWIAENRPVPMRSFLPTIFRDMGALRLRSLENPLSFSTALRRHWVDVGLVVSSNDDVRLIPFSVFTRRFFQEEMPDLISSISGPGGSDWPRGDSFYYHPENDQAISLKERFPALCRLPTAFQYFVDESGLAEIVLEKRALRRRDLLLAAQLFCLQNRVRFARLDGRKVPQAALTT